MVDSWWLPSAINHQQARCKLRILGIDPGLKRTGYGLVDVTAQYSIKLVEAGTVEPNEKDIFENRIHKIYINLEKIVNGQKPDVMVLEKLYAHHKHPITASILGHVRGVICLLCAQKNVELVEHSVKRIRQSLTGNGNATKVQTRRMVASAFGVKEEQLTLDASDALALALGYLQMNRDIYDRKVSR